MRAFVDTNIFVYATYPALPQFAKAREFLKSCLKGSDFWYLSWGVVYEYLRVATHPVVFPGKTVTLLQAIENVLRFCRSPRVEILQETPEHPEYLKGLHQEPQSVFGSILHDAHLVVLMREHDVKKIYSADTDFHRFRGIEVVNPLT